MLRWPPKDPNEVAEYDVTWALGTDTISASTWSLSGATSLVLSNPVHTDKIARVTLSGGTDGQEYSVRNTVTTAAGDTFVETILILIKKK